MSVAVPWAPICPLLLARADPEESITSGREALDHWWRYPWYDSATDGVRRVDIPEPWDWSWLWDWLPDWNWFPNWRSMFGIPDSFLQWLAWILLVLVLIGGVYLLVRTYRNRQGARADSDDEADAAESDDADRIEALPFPIGRDRLDLLGEARRYYRQGNYGQAIIYLFSFQLVQLDKRQVIRLAKGKTNRQYLREVGSASSLRSLVEQTMTAFEDVFFGHHRIDRTRFESCWSRLEELGIDD